MGESVGGKSSTLTEYINILYDFTLWIFDLLAYGGNRYHLRISQILCT